MRGAASLARRLFALATSATGIYLASSILAKAGAIVLIPLYTRKLSVVEFGDYGLAQTLAGVAPMFLSLGTMAAVSMFYFTERDVELSQRKSGGAARVNIALTSMLALLTQLGILAFGTDGEGLGSRRVLSLVLWGGVGTHFAGIPGLYYRARQRPLHAAAYDLLQFFATVGTAYLLVVVLARGLTGAIEAVALGGVLTGVVGVAFALGVMPGRLDREMAKETIAYSLPFVPHYASMQITSISDRWVMKGAGHGFDLGSYSLAVTITGPVGMVLGAWNEAESPKVGEAIRSGGRRAFATRFPRLIAQYALMAMVPGLLLLGALPILKLVVGRVFAQALWPVPVMLGLLVLESAFSPSILVLSYLKQTRLIPRITMSCALVHLVLNLLLIPWLGIAGALVARAVAGLARSAALVVTTRRVLREDDDATPAISGAASGPG